MKFKNILAPLDLEGKSVPGLEAAAGIVRDHGGKITVVHVMTGASVQMGDTDHVAVPAKAQAEDRARAKLKDVVDGATLDVPVDTEVVWGDPAMEIHKLAGSIGADAIVITVKNRSRVGKLLLGSHAQQIILGADRPVICVPLN